VQSNPKLRKAFGSVLRSLRESNDVSQQELADNCDMERAYVSRLERGLLQPTITTVFNIAEFFKLSPGELLNQVQLLYKKKK
jgi:transcriptional regulator with XRE-family HTH domain